MENIVQAQAEEQQEQRRIPTPAGRVPDAVIGRALTSGGNDQHSIEHIIAFFQKEHTGSAAASFMEREYGEGGKGVSIAGQDYALWFSREGFRIAPGRSAYGPGSTLIPWVNAAAMTVNLLRNGTFATQDRINAARDNEFRELAETLWFLRRDFSEEAKETGYLAAIAKAYAEPGFPEGTKAIENVLRNPEEREKVEQDMRRFDAAYRDNHKLLRFRRSPNSVDLYSRIAGMDRPVTKYQAVDGFVPVRASFVTEDEVNRFLAGGPSISESKLQIYSYFVQGHNEKECADFLRESYGTGGITRTSYDEWHDSKGIRMTRSDERSGFKGYDTVQLNWYQAAKRIRGLIDSGRYLNEQERTYLPGYDKLTLARKIYAFQYHDPNGPPDRHPWNIEIAKQDILPLLDDPEKSAALYEDMTKALAVLSPDSKEYQQMEPALQDMGAFQRGEYSLFTPLPEEVLRAERQAKRAAKESRKDNTSKRPDSKTPDVPGDRLAEAARALAKKMQKDTREDEDGQITFDFMAMSPQPQQEQAAAEQESETIVTTQNYEVTIKAEEAPLLTKLLADKGIDTAQFIHSNGDVTFSFAASVRDDVEKLVAQLKAEQTRAAAAGHPAAKSPKPGRTRVELNYRSFARLFPEIASGEYRYMELKAGDSMMPLHLEWIGRDEIAVSHTYTLNGDLMRDPEMTFRVDREKGTLEPLTFRQDGSIPIYQEVYPEPGRWIPKLRSDLNSFAQQWLKNISEQNYHKHEAVVERDGEDVRLTFDQDGKVVEPVAEPAAENTLDDNSTIREIYEHYASMVKNLVLADEVYRNACVNSDQDLAHLEGNEAVHRAVLAINDPSLMKQYFDNTAFHNRLHQEIINETYPALSKSQQEQTAEVQEASAAWVATPVTLYEDAVEILDRAVKNSSLYRHLRDRDLDYDSAAEALNAEMPQLMETARGYPDIMAAYQSLPMFREWLVEDILERNYQDIVTDQRLAPERYANSPDAPEWARDSPIVDHSELERAGDSIETPPTAETVPEPSDAGTLEQPENASAPGSHTALDQKLLEPAYKAGDTVYIENKPFIISGISLSEIQLQYPNAAVPIFTSEKITRFEYLLRQDPRNKAVSEYLSTGTDRIRPDVRGILTVHLLSERDRNDISRWFRSGEGNTQIAERIEKMFSGRADTVSMKRDWTKTGELTADYSADARGFHVTHPVYAGVETWEQVAAIFRSLWQQELDGFSHEPPVMDHSEPERAGDSIETPPAAETVPEPTGAGALEEPENAAAATAEPDLTPNVDEYLNLKAQHPDKLIGVQVGDYMMFYGKDAEEAASALGTNLVTREITGLGSTSVTGYQGAWQAVLKKLLEHGQSVVLAQPDSERGPDAHYEIIQERDAADYIPLGMELTIDGRRMKIDSVDFQAGTVSLQDLDMKGWLPIFRSEPVAFVREIVEEVQNRQIEQEIDDLSDINPAEIRDSLAKYGIVNGQIADPDAFERSPINQEVQRTVEMLSASQPEQIEIDGGQIVETPAQKRRRREAEQEVSDRVFPSEIILQPLRFGPERHNFHITDDNLGAGGEKAKYQYNVAAIRTLKQIETEGRLATPEEQETLSRYVGWGGIAQAFDPNDSKWAKEYAELKELLTPEEYTSARSTVLNAHYTSPTVIKAMYQAVERMDFQPGTVLDIKALGMIQSRRTIAGKIL